MFSDIQMPQINKEYTAMFSNNAVDKTTKKLIQQTLKFEKNMFKLTFGQCSICHQGRLNMKTLKGICCKC